MADSWPDNAVKQKLWSGDLVLCMALRQARTADTAQIVHACGFDAFYVDQEHSTITCETTSMICTAALGIGLVPLVRVPSTAAHHIGAALDGGALGVIAPHIDTAADAATLVSHAMYPPLGTRSISSVGPATRYRSIELEEFVRRQNHAIMVVAMLESEAAVTNADDIAATPGIDILLVGAQDLSAALGLTGQLDHPRLYAAYEHVREVSLANGKHFSVGGVNQTIQSDMISKGARFITAGIDVKFLMNAATAEVQRLRLLVG